MQRGRPMQAPASAPEKTPPTEKRMQSLPDTFPRWAVNVPVTDSSSDAPSEQIAPRDFTFEKEFSDMANEMSASVYPENIPTRPDINGAPETRDAPDISESNETEPREEGAFANADVYEKLEDISSSMRNMTLEDMMLAGLLMMGSSGEYDDETMLILGLILMIGA